MDEFKICFNWIIVIKEIKINKIKKNTKKVSWFKREANKKWFEIFMVLLNFHDLNFTKFYTFFNEFHQNEINFNRKICYLNFF